MKFKPLYLVVLFLIALVIGFCKEAKADVTFEAGPTLLSSRFGDGGMLYVSEHFGDYSLGIGYVTKQYCHCSYATDLNENIFIQGQRHVDLWRLNLGLGMAYWQNTNRALGKRMTFAVLIGTNLSEHWSVQFRHYSNAGSGAPNLGQDAVTLAYTF